MAGGAPHLVERWTRSWANALYLLTIEVGGFALIRHGVDLHIPALIAPGAVMIGAGAVGFHSWLRIQRHTGRRARR